MPRRTRPRNAPQPTPTSPPAGKRSRWAHVAESTTIDNRPPSYVAATKHSTDGARYREQDKKAIAHAMDFSGDTSASLTFVAATAFPGFPSLSLLGQLAEYRSMHETLADECIRMWGKASSSGATPPERLADIEAELERLDVRAVVRQSVIHDQAFGRAHVYTKLRGDELGRDVPLLLKPYSVPKGALEGFRAVEAYWVTPNNYNSIDPSAADFYKPSTWWMLGTEVHATRLQTLVSRPVADMLKPAYSFAGVSMTQLAMPYVDNWLRTRQSVSDAVKQFAVSGVLTDLEQALLPGGSADLQARAQLLNLYRDNRNLLFLDKATEEYFTVPTPLAGLHELQAQAQEQMSAVSHIPLVKLLGLTPTGLNASSEGEIRTYYDYVRGYQSNVLTPLLLNMVRLVQLSLFGEIDPNVSWEWLPLHELTDLEQADKRAKDAEADVRYVEIGALTPEQVARRLNADPAGLYSGLLTEDPGHDQLPDDDIPGIVEHILTIGKNDETVASPGQETPGTGGDPSGQSDPGALPGAVAEGPGEHAGELRPLGAAPVQRRPDREPVGGPDS